MEIWKVLDRELEFFRHRDGKFYLEIWKVLDREMGGLDRNGEGINYQQTLQPLRTR